MMKEDEQKTGETTMKGDVKKKGKMEMKEGRRQQKYSPKLGDDWTFTIQSVAYGGGT